MSNKCQITLVAAVVTAVTLVAGCVVGPHLDLLEGRIDPAKAHVLSL